jgi:hypothetical protein
MQNEAQLNPKSRAKVLKKCDLLLSILSGESGKIQAKLEGGGEQ